MIKKILFMLTIFSLLLAACGAPATSRELEEAPVAAPAQPQSDFYSGASGESYDMSNANYATDGSAVERMVVKNVQLSMAVEDPETSAGRIQAMAEEMGGYVVSVYMYQTTLDNGAKVSQGNVTVRVPAERLNEALDTIKSETTQPVINENINSDDVTAEYTDLASRLRNLEAAEQQLQEIMDQATKTEDVLSVYSQLVSTREQIEVIKGQMQYYEQAAALSSVQVELYANEAVQPLSIGTWKPQGVARDAVQTLINTLKGLGNVAIWIVLYVLPVAICVLGPLALIIWGVTRLYNKRKQAKALVPSQE
jgi:PBP1b-binding outer membrane lipoprotein LpoB